MSPLDWFNKKSPAPIVRPDELMTVYDERGRELKIRRADWVKQMLLPNIEKAWNDPNALNREVVQAIRDQFIAQVVDASERLVEIARDSEDALMIAAVVRRETGNLDGAQKLLERSIANHGATGVVFTNLATLLERRGRIAESRATLRRGLDLDPNQENALLWFAALARDENGEAGYLSALTEIAGVAGAWRPELWLAREKLKAGDRQGALQLYEMALARAAQIPNVLTMVTGDLGNVGALEDVVRIAGPIYEPQLHGPHAGFNLIGAYKELGRLDEARELVRRLQAMPWPPFAQSLAALDEEIASASIPKGAQPTPSIATILLELPLWTRSLFEPTWLFSSRTDADPCVVLFTFANETIKGDEARVQKSDHIGRLTRALPLYLAEMLLLRFRLRTRAHLLVSQGQGPVIFGQQLPREQLDPMVAEVKGRRILISGSLIEVGVRLSFWEVGTNEPATTLTVECSLDDPALLMTRVERAIRDAFAKRALLTECRPPIFYQSPPEQLLASYLSALEQLFFQMLAANKILDPTSIWNERGFSRRIVAWSTRGLRRPTRLA